MRHMIQLPLEQRPDHSPHKAFDIWEVSPFARTSLPWRPFVSMQCEG